MKGMFTQSSAMKVLDGSVGSRRKAWRSRAKRSLSETRSSRAARSSSGRSARSSRKPS